MTAGVVIRDLGRIDLQSLLGLYRHLHRQDEALPDASQVEEIWGRILRDSGQIYLGAFTGDALVAACNASVIPNLTRGARPYAVIENVVTDEAYRRRGIGTSLLRALLERCWSLRCYKVMLMSAASRSEIHGFYESLGFDKTSKQAFVIAAR